MLLADKEAASEVRLRRAREPRDDGKENPFTWLGYLVHLDCGASRLFDFKTQTTRVKYWLAAKCSSTILKKRPPCVRPGTHKTRYTLPRPLVVLVGVQRNLESPFVASSTYIVPYKKPLRPWLIVWLAAGYKPVPCHLQPIL